MTVPVLKKTNKKYRAHEMTVKTNCNKNTYKLFDFYIIYI